MGFDVAGALRAGYEPSEIADHLAAENGFDVAGARDAGYSDEEILRHLAQGAAPPAERTWTQAAGDTAVQLAEGVNTLAGAVPNLVAPDSSAAQFFNENADYWREQQSAPMQERIARASEAIDQAGEDGVISQIVEASKQYFSDPALAARFVTTNLPSMLPGIGVAKLAKAASLARGATEAQAIAKATAAAGGVNAGLNAGGARGDAFEDVKRTLIEQGLSEEEATDQALKDSRVAAAVGALAGYVSGKTGLENSVVGGAAKGGAARAFGGGLIKEAAGEQLEEVTPQLATNFMAGQYDDRPITQDVGRTIVETAIGAGPGSILSGGMDAHEASRQRRAVAEENLRNAPDAGSAAAAANELAGAGELAAAADELAASVDAYLQDPVAAPVAAPVAPAARSIPELRGLIDRQMELAGLADNAGFQFDRENALAQAAVARGAPRERTLADFVDIKPMDESEANTRLTVLKDMLAQEGQDVSNLAVVPHPSREGAFAIARQEPAPAVDTGPTQADLVEAQRNIEARGGVASPQEAQVIEHFNAGRPYDRIDESLAPPVAPAPVTPEEVQPRLEAAAQQRMPAPPSPLEAAAQQRALPPLETPAAQREAPGIITPVMQRSRPDVQRARDQATLEEENAASMADLTERTRADQAQSERKTQAQVDALNQPAAAPDANDLIAAMAVPGAQRSAEQTSIVRQGKARYSEADFSILERAAKAPFQFNATERMRLRELREPAPTQATPAPTSKVRATPLMGSRVADRLGIPSEGRVVTSNAKLSSRREPIPGSTGTVQDGDLEHEFKVVDPGSLGNPGRVLRQIGRIFGKRLVVFQSDTLQADGFVLNDDSSNIYVNARSGISPLAVFGHELMHLLKRDNPAAYAAVEAVVKANLSDENRARFDEYYGEGSTLEELTADLMGNRMQENDFWTKVFAEIEAQNPEEAKSIISRLAAALKRAIAAFLNTVKQRGFESDALVSDLNAVRDALQSALASYAQQQRAPAQALERGGEQTTDEAAPAGGEALLSAVRRGGTAEDIGEFRVRTQKDGSLGVAGDVEQIRTLLPEGVKGRPVPGGLLFTTSDAPRVKAALEGRKLAYSRGGQVLDKLPMKDGKYVGAPPKYNTPAKIASLRKSLRTLTREGERGRYWYENSSREVLQMVGGNVQEARKFVALLAIYSPQAKVDANSTFALRAWAQYKAGEPINVKTRVQDVKAQAAMDDVDAFWSGEKTGNFFFNLLREIDPNTEGKQGATIDMWMMRAGEYATDRPTDTQYAFMENETNRIAQEFGWEPQQVQAAIWVAMKARMENKGVKNRTEATSEKKGWIRFDYPLKNGKPIKTRVILNAQAHRDNWLMHALAHTPTEADTSQAKFDFADGLRRHIGQLSWDAIPANSSNVLPGASDADQERQVEFRQAVQKALTDNDGVDLLAYKLGLLIDGPDILAPGVWQGAPVTRPQKQIALAPGKADAGSTIDPAQRKAIDAYASMLGLLLRQEKVGYHRPFFKGSKAQENGIDVVVGRAFSREEAQALWGAIDQRMRERGVEDWEANMGLVTAPTGMRVVNLGAFRDNAEFKAVVKDAAETLPIDQVKLASFSTDGDQISNDWKENPNGESYRSRISEAYGPDLLDWAGDVLAPRIQTVFNEFSARYGWGDAGQVPLLERSARTEEVASSRAKLSRKRVTETPEFKQWFGDSKVVDANGDPLVVYHGTTNDFDTFRRNKSDIESDMGAGFYFSNNPSDVGINYAGEGADLTARIEMLAERIANDDEFEGTEEDAKAEARRRLSEGRPNMMPAFLSLLNPVIVGGPDETVFTYEEEYNEELDEYEEPTGTLVDFIEALRRVGGEYGDFDAEKAVADIFASDDVSGGLPASRLIELLKASEGLMYSMDYDRDGALASGEITRQAFEDAGYDGIIDHTVDTKFGSQRRLGMSMEGIDPDTVHYIAFRPEQIKSATGNNGQFDARNPRITMSRQRDPAAIADRSARDEGVAYSRRRKPAPKKTVTAYKLFRVNEKKPGQLFPLFIGKNEPVEVGVWYDADDIPTKGFASRPGWHAGILPMATHIGEKSRAGLVAPDTRPDNQVWAEIEMSADKDWQPEANRRGTNAQGKVVAARADIKDQVPTNGYYRYKTNPNMEGEWLIGGSIKVKRVLSDDEVRKINEAQGAADLPRKAPFDAEKYGVNFSRQRVTDTAEFKRWFGDSQVVDENGEPRVIYRGFNLASDGALNAEPRDGYAAFGSSSPYVANSYANPDVTFGGDGAITPVYIKADKLIEFPVREDRYGYRRFDMFEFDRKAKSLRAGEVLVARQVVDIGPRARTDIDPEKLYSYQSDIYAWNKGTSVKSAIGNNGQFDARNPRITMSRQRSPLGFYSALADSIDKIQTKAAPAAGWKDAIKGLLNKGQVKADEVEWSGVLDWLDMQQGKVTRDQVADYLKEGGVQVEETVRNNTERNAWVVFSGGDEVTVEKTFEDPFDAQEWLDANGNEDWFIEEHVLGERQTRYDQYTLPGGENYKELLLTLPAQRDRVIAKGDKESVYEAARASGLDFYVESTFQGGEYTAYARGTAQDYKSRHWNEGNVLAHVRINEREDADGNTVLFIEEIQSDWHQAGRKKGYNRNLTALPTGFRVDKDGSSSWNVWDAEGNTYATGAITEAQAVRNALSRLNAGVPDAPFKQSWPMLAMKRVIRWAAENGFDRVAWTTGDMQTGRYDLSKEVREIAYFKPGNHTGISVPEGSVGLDISLKGRASRQQTVKESELPALLGKELAEKITNAGPQGVISGEGLRMGGEGMKGFYDKILPAEVNKYIKKWGGRVEKTNLRNPRYSSKEMDRHYEEHGFYPDQDADIFVHAFDVTDAMRDSVMVDGQPLFSRRRNPMGGPVLSTWTAPSDTKLDPWIYSMQDKHVDTKRVVETLRSAIGAINDKWNPYLQEELYHGRTAKQTADFLNDELRPLLQSMQARGVTVADFEEYLHNRHAEERNEQIARVNPNMPDGGSGIDTADARAYLAGLDPVKRRALEALAARVDTISKGTRDLLVSSGLETKDTIDAWEAAYSKYVPLNREDLDFGAAGSLGSGQGYSVRGSASKRATGSKRDVVDILANLAMQRERAIVRAQKNRVATALYGLAVTNPNTKFWLPVNPDAMGNPVTLQNELVGMGLNPLDAKNLVQEPKQTYIDPRTGLVAQRVNPVLRSNDNVLALRVEGKDRYVFFNNNDPRSQRMVTALKNLDADQLGRVLSMAGKVSRYFASVNTQYNPIWGAVNFTRDLGGAAINLTSTPLAGRQAEVMGNAVVALRGIYSDLRSRRKGRGPATGTWATLWEEFQREGGQTGFRDHFSKSEERAKALEAELKKLTEGKLKHAGRVTFDWLSDFNETLENAVRLSAYKAAKDKGMSKEQAASLAKNLTVNFNRKGQVAAQAGALYAFFNASVQGTARLAETLAGPAGKKIVAGGLLLGAAQAMLLAAAGFDDDEPPDFVRERNLVIPTGDGKYTTIPLPLGFHVIPNTSRVLTEWALSGWRDPAKRVGQVTGALLDAFNPIGNAGWSAQTFTPTFLDPYVALTENRDWTGKPIAKEDRSGTDPTPGYLRAKDTATWLSTQLAYYLNLATGGTKYKPGFWSPTPDQLDYLAGQVGGGVGREIMKTEQWVRSAASGEELPPYKVPFIGRWRGDTKSASSTASRFYDNITRLNEHENELEGRRANRENPGAYLADNPEARFVKAANAADNAVQKLRKRKRELLKRGASKESIRIVETQITRRMERLNEMVKSAR